MRKIKEVLRLSYEKGLPAREIARSLNIGRGTIRNYLDRNKNLTEIKRSVKYQKTPTSLRSDRVANIDLIRWPRLIGTAGQIPSK